VDSFFFEKELKLNLMKTRPVGADMTEAW